MPRKKKRTAKQIAATKKLVAFNKKRRGKKKATRRNTPRARRNPKRAAKSHLWFVFKCYGKIVHFLGIKSGALTGWKRHKGQAILFKEKAVAQRVANTLSKKRGFAHYQFGIANANTTAAQIAAQCKAGKA